VSKPGLRLADGPLTLSAEQDIVLQEVADVCLLPNLAELEVLEQALGTPIRTIAAWCEYHFQHKGMIQGAKKGQQFCGEHEERTDFLLPKGFVLQAVDWGLE